MAGALVALWLLDLATARANRPAGPVSARQDAAAACMASCEAIEACQSIIYDGGVDQCYTYACVVSGDGLEELMVTMAKGGDTTPCPEDLGGLAGQLLPGLDDDGDAGVEMPTISLPPLAVDYPATSDAESTSTTPPASSAPATVGVEIKYVDEYVSLTDAATEWVTETPPPFIPPQNRAANGSETETETGTTASPESTSSATEMPPCHEGEEPPTTTSSLAVHGGWVVGTGMPSNSTVAPSITVEVFLGGGSRMVVASWLVVALMAVAARFAV